jgi:hypothetical protein
MRVSGQTQGRGPVPWTTVQASIVFGRLVISAFSILRLTPGSTFYQPIGTMQLWDLPSVASLSRNLVEASFVLHYLSARLPASNAELREVVWRYHEKSEVYKMLKNGSPRSQRLEELKKNVEALREKIESHPAFQAFPKKFQKRVLFGEIAKLQTNEELCRDSGIDPGYYNCVFKYGSNHTHSSPFCFTEMDKFRADEEPQREEGMLWMSLQGAAGFLAFAIREFIKIFPDQEKVINPDEQYRLAFWEQVLMRGPASLAAEE